MSSVIVVQQILTHWSKASRGGKGAVKRNAVPEVACLPLNRVEQRGLTLLHHKLAFYEPNFSRPKEEISLNPTLLPHVVGCVKIDYGKEVAIASFRFGAECGGAPLRGWARKTLYIAEGEWGQILYNGRFANRVSGWWWWYEKMVVNVGLFSELPEDVFTRCPPTYRVSEMAHLI
jgi:hypothetical protein